MRHERRIAVLVEHAADREPADHEVDEFGNAESTHCVPLRARSWFDRVFEEVGTERLVHPTVRCEWAADLRRGSAIEVVDPLARRRFRGRYGSHSIGARK